MARHVRAALAVSALVVAASCTSSSTRSSPTTAPRTRSGSTVWLCMPGARPDPCTDDLTTTVQAAAGGQAKVAKRMPATDPPVDCFYVYPTVSAQKGPNADLRIDPEEIAVAQQQASQFSTVCKVFAPMYPQLTLASIGTGAAGETARNKAFEGVRSAWDDYLAHYNRGRGVVLIGHSQGAGMLARLVAEEIDPNASQRKRLVSAILLGGDVVVPAGRDVGGDFQHVPACRSTHQRGCVIAFSTFASTPPPNALFGRPRGVVRSGQAPVQNAQVLCTNPAALAGGSGELRSMFRKTALPGALGPLAARVFGDRPPVSETPWTEWDGYYRAACVNEGGATYLQVTPVEGHPPLTPEPDATWGLHLVDVNITLGNLIDVVREQAANR